MKKKKCLRDDTKRYTAIDCHDKSFIFEKLYKILYGPSFPFEKEYAFCKGRKFRFDFAHIEKKIAVEVDGGIYMPFGGRHGGDSDREKLNIAAMNGWKVFRFSTMMLKSDPQYHIGLLMVALNGIPEKENEKTN